MVLCGVLWCVVVCDVELCGVCVVWCVVRGVCGWVGGVTR